MSSVIISSHQSNLYQCKIWVYYTAVFLLTFPIQLLSFVYIHHKFDHVFNILKLVHSILVVAICAFVYKSSNKYILKGY